MSHGEGADADLQPQNPRLQVADIARLSALVTTVPITWAIRLEL